MATSTEATRPANWLVGQFGQQFAAECDPTSVCTLDYNCVGFVAGDFEWWQPGAFDGHFWPDGVEQDERCWAHLYVKALSTVGFEEHRPVERVGPDFELAAVFHESGVFRHVSRWDASSGWQSKLGAWDDIRHPDMNGVRSSYGKHFQTLRRRIEHRPVMRLSPRACAGRGKRIGVLANVSGEIVVKVVAKES